MGWGHQQRTRKKLGMDTPVDVTAGEGMLLRLPMGFVVRTNWKECIRPKKHQKAGSHPITAHLQRIGLIFISV